MSQVPLLILSDAATSPTGLGRITRELAIRIHEQMQDTFRVATMGVGGAPSRHLPFMQYPVTKMEQYALPELPSVWQDFAGEEEGVVLCIQNAPWVWWLADPTALADGELKDFLKSKPFKRWIYPPIDGHGPNFTIPLIKPILSKFDRVLAYTKYGAAVINKTLGVTGTPNLPHGLDSSVFYPRDYKEARRTFVERILGKPASGLNPSITLLGVVATNSSRKDWYLALEVCGELLKRGVNVGLWAHTGNFRGHWDIPTLADEFGMTKRIMLSNNRLSDEDLAWAYSALDASLCIGSGEGWGLPITESLACGTPVVHGDYAGGAELTPRNGLIEPAGFHADGYYFIKRPVFRASDWADVVQSYGKGGRGLSLLAPYIEWDNAFPEWKKWLKEGAK